jgi:hypothetical protein
MSYPPRPPKCGRAVRALFSIARPPPIERLVETAHSFDGFSPSRVSAGGRRDWTVNLRASRPATLAAGRRVARIHIVYAWLRNFTSRAPAAKPAHACFGRNQLRTVRTLLPFAGGREFAASPMAVKLGFQRLNDDSVRERSDEECRAIQVPKEEVASFAMRDDCWWKPNHQNQEPHCSLRRLTCATISQIRLILQRDWLTEVYVLEGA